jgi:hypothetical protein
VHAKYFAQLQTLASLCAALVQGTRPVTAPVVLAAMVGDGLTLQPLVIQQPQRWDFRKLRSKLQQMHGRVQAAVEVLRLDRVVDALGSWVSGCLCALMPWNALVLAARDHTVYTAYSVVAVGWLTWISLVCSTHHSAVTATLMGCLALLHGCLTLGDFDFFDHRTKQ